MKKFRFFKLLVFILISVFLSSVSSAQEKDEAKLVEVFEAISRARVYIEFYFMEAGEYPETLDQLEKDLNSLLPPELEKIKFPTDPATGGTFVYKQGSDKKSYTLSVPEPVKYGVSKLEFVNVPWAGFTQIAQERKLRFLQMICVENIKLIANALEAYASRNNGKYPSKLKDLIPKYVVTMPVCPITNKLYEYKVEGDNCSIACPNPKEHQMNTLMYSTSRGWITK